MPTAHRIGPQEDELLVLLSRYVRVTAEQATRHSYSPNSLRHVRKYLNNLRELGYVDRAKGFTQSGNPPYVYALTLKGWRYIEDHYGLPIPHTWKPSETPRIDYADYRHDLGITDTGIAIERFCRHAAPYVTFIQFQQDRFLPQTRIPLPDQTTQAFRPDGFVELHIRRDDSGRKKQRCHLIEYDRGTHYEKAVRKKFQLQLRYVRDGHYKRDFGTDSLSYLWVCPGGPERVKLLKKILETVLREQQATDLPWLFLLTAENPATVDPVDLFLNPVWQLPFAAEPVSLLTFPSAQDLVRLDRSRYLPQADYEQFLQATGEDVLQVAGEMDLA